MAILVVDDQRINREIIGSVLEKYEYKVLVAENGQQAVDLFVSGEYEISIILMDLNMPVMDGFEATKKIKAAAASKHIPIIFVTATDDSKTLAKCLTVGGDDFVAKPIDENVLIAKIRVHHRVLNLQTDIEKKLAELHVHHLQNQREHEIVEKVFQNSMMRLDKDCDNINYHLSPMSMFNGDLFLSAPSQSGGVYILLGDFTGHGLAAAIGCMPVSDIFYAMTAKQVSVGDMAAEMNRRLGIILPNNMFCCLAIVEMSRRGDRLSLWVGGMNDLILCSANGVIKKKIASQHMPIGILSEPDFDSTVEIIQPPAGGRLYLYTDGVIEAENNNSEFFGEDRLAAIFTRPSDNYVDAIFSEVEKFCGGVSQNDDIGVVELICEPVMHGGRDDSGEVEEVSPVIPSTIKQRFSWSASVVVMPEQMRSTDVVEQVLDILSGVKNFDGHKDILYTLLSEIYCNALEHGVLSLKSSLKEGEDGFSVYYGEREKRLSVLTEGEIAVNLNVVAGTKEGQSLIVISMTDSGEGFDISSINMTSNKDGDEDSHGRGLLLLNSLCVAVNYSNDGRTVELKYLIQ